MNKMTFAAAVIRFIFHASYSEEMSATGWYAAFAVVMWAVPHWLALYSPRTAAAQPEHIY